LPLFTSVGPDRPADVMSVRRLTDFCVLTILSRTITRLYVAFHLLRYCKFMEPVARDRLGIDSRLRASHEDAQPARISFSGMKLTVLFPALLLLLNLGAAVVCFATRDWNRGFYWLASAVCVGVVAFQ
jgi:hypothetical protein